MSFTRNMNVEVEFKETTVFFYQLLYALTKLIQQIKTTMYHLFSSDYVIFFEYVRLFLFVINQLIYTIHISKQTKLEHLLLLLIENTQTHNKHINPLYHTSIYSSNHTLETKFAFLAFYELSTKRMYPK